MLALGAPSTGAAALGALLALLLLGAPSPAKSESHRPPPLHERALSHPQDLSFHVLPRRTHTHSALVAKRDGQHRPTPQALRVDLDSSRPPAWDDRFLLSFLAHDGEPVTLSLRPSANLVPAAGVRSIERWRDDKTGEWRSAERVLARQDVRAYEGWVIPDDEDVERWIREEVAGVLRPGRAGAGWARVVLSSQTGGLRDDDDAPVRFQGTYTKDGEQFTVHATERYLRTKDDLDPDPPLVTPRRRSRRAFGGADNAVLAPRHPSMVIVRESAIMTPHERIAALTKRGLPLPDPASFPSREASSCSHDALAFNTDPAHPVYAAAYPQASFDNSSSWLSYLSGGATVQPFTPADHSSLFSPQSYRYVSSDRRSAMWKRQGDDISGGSGTSNNFISSIGDTSGCPKSAMVVFVGVASDCTYTQSYGSPAGAREQILTDFNSASALYQESFNISLGIVELAVMNTTCPSSSADVDSAYPWNLPCPTSGSGSASGSGIGVDLNTRLSIFSQWRGDKGASDGAGLWHLLTECQTGSEVGVAWLGQLCKVTASSSGGQTTSGTGVTAITRSEWQVIAHEIGHNFGAIHDCASGCSLSGSCCPLSTTTCNANADFIMSPVSQKNVSTFSPCSIGNICSTLSNSLNTTCLATPGSSGNPAVISLQSCGNGIKEEGEDCDPGSDTEDPCCDARTCKFAPGAVCDPRNSLCCTSQCQIASNGTVCRAAVDQRCDIAEMCDGSSRECPKDDYKKDGSGCGDGLSCATGVCTSRDLQCRNAGSTLGLTKACPTSASSTCNIICDDPTTSSSCVILDQSFRDGTSCGYGGRCRGGSCQTGSALDTAKGWYRDHLNIAIPVTIVVALLVLAILYALVRCCCCRGRPAKGAAPLKPGRGQPHSARYAVPPGQQSMAQPMTNGYYPPNGSYYPPAQGPPTGSYYPSSPDVAQGSFYAAPPGPPPMHPSNAYQGELYHQPRNVLRR
ncbi:hypothetical protein JCM3770_003427 [Rhodotorula araucariae]